MKKILLFLITLIGSFDQSQAFFPVKWNESLRVRRHLEIPIDRNTRINHIPNNTEFDNHMDDLEQKANNYEEKVRQNKAYLQFNGYLKNTVLFFFSLFTNKRCYNH